MNKRTAAMFPRIAGAVFLLLALVFTFTFSARNVFAEAQDTASDSAESTEEEVYDGSVESNGLSITTTTDKESYKDGETAVLTVSVKNTNDYELTDVTLDYTVPKNFSLAEGDERSQTIDSIAAGETKEFQVSAVVTEDPDALLVESVSRFSPTALLAAVIALIVMIAMIFVIGMFQNNKKTPKPPKKMLSAFLVLVLVTVSFSNAAPALAWTEDGLVEEWDYGRVSVHDPSVVKDPESGVYYIFGSHLSFAKTEDLISWQSFRNNINTDYETLFEEPWAWAGAATTSGGLSGMMWAPDVIWNDTMQKWCMYMSINGDNWCSSICLLTADNIEGPYEYAGIVVYSGMNNPNVNADVTQTDVYKVLGEDADLSRYATTAYSCINAIDPCVRYDENGDLYMSYGSWSAGIYMLKLDTKTGLRDYSTSYESERDVSDAYFGVKIAGGYYCSGEGSYILKAGDYYYLFLSYAGLEAMGGYQMRVYRSESITGPYVDENGVSAIRTSQEDVKKTNYGVKLFGSYSMSGLAKIQVAQGHNSAFVDDDGKIYLVYHTRFQSDTGTNEGHQVRVHQMFINEDGWLVAAPYEYSGETISEDGYSTEDVCLTYDFIYHEPTQYYQVVGNIQLGIAGYEESTTADLEFKKETVVAHRQAIVNFKLSYTHEGSAKVTLHEDGTVTGDYSGSWKATDGANVEMVLNGVTYKGVFLKQQDESISRNMRMTFTLLGDNVTVWGVQSGEMATEE
jgi:arabinan endo-1,5-alpha-L-arabinosidase